MMNSLYNPKIWKKQNTILVKLPYTDFDHKASEHFKEMINDLIDKHTCHSVILDFSNVSLVDGIGLAAIVSAFHDCSSKDIKLILCSLNEGIKLTIEKKGLCTMLEMFNNIHDAVDMATKYSYIIQSREKTTKSMESIFGNPFEEKISYK